MKNIRFSLVEKKLLRMLIVFILIQLVIILTFVNMLINSKQINTNETKQSNINIDAIYCYRIAKSNQLFIVADSKYYLFTSRSTLKEYSVYNICESISIGDRLSLTYYEAYNIFLGQINVVVDAYSETETYRTLEEYNRAREGVPIFVVALYSIIELVFGGVVFIYVWLNYSILKGINKKIKN